LKIIFDRSNVCMGDDCQSHKEELETEGEILLSSFIELYILKRLALISGGKATWILRAKTDNETYRDIAVMAQQWKDAKLLINDCKLIDLFNTEKVVDLFALYQLQEDPITTYNKLLSNNK